MQLFKAPAMTPAIPNTTPAIQAMTPAPTWGETVLAGLHAAGAPNAEAAEAMKAAVELETAAWAAVASPGLGAWDSVWAAAMNVSVRE